MLSAKLLVFLAFQVVTVFGLRNNALLNLPVLDEEQLNWPQQKIETIEYLLNTLSEVGNVTLIGWQQILNSDGSLAEIRTVELTILAQIPSDVVLSSEEIDFDEELPPVIEVMKSLSSATGIWLSGIFVQNDRSGIAINAILVDPNNILLDVDGILPFWERNITTSNPAEIRNLVQTWENQSTIPVSVLEWNANGTLNISSSVIVPELFASVVAAANATLPMLESAMMGTVKAMLLQSEEVSAYVAMHMKNSVPGFNWIVGQDWLASTDSDVSVDILYDLVPIGLPPVTINIIGLSI